MTDVTREEILSGAIALRRAEILRRDVDAETYRQAIALIPTPTGDDTIGLEMERYKRELRRLFDEAQIEKARAQVLLDALLLQSPEDDR